MEYRFVEIEVCNMCLEPTRTAKVLGRRLNRSQGLNPRARSGISTTVMRCRRCDLVFANPLPVPKDLEQHYGVPPESYWVESYFTLEPEYFREQIERYFELAGTRGQSGLKALDIGAGIGKCMLALESAGLEAHGLEPAAPFYERAVGRMKISAERLQHAPLESAEFERDHFDFVTFGAVLEHLYDPSAAIERALGWTKPGGLVHIEVPSSHWLTNRIVNALYRLQGLDYVANISPMHAPFHLYEFSRRSFERNAERLGYELAHHEHHVCQTYLPRALDFFVKPLMAKSDTGMQLSIWLRKRAR